MGDRFYQAQLKDRGMCPGPYNSIIRKRKTMAWDDTKRKNVIEAYVGANPTAEDSTEIIADLADKYGESVNGVRLVLVKAGVYVKKEAGAKPASAASDKAPRVGKEAAQARLTAAINNLGAEVNDEIISKMTGKAAIYIAEILEKAA